MFVFEQYIKTNSLKIGYSFRSKSEYYTPLAADMEKAKANDKVFNECLSRLGLKYDRRQFTLEVLFSEEISFTKLTFFLL